MELPSIGHVITRLEHNQLTNKMKASVGKKLHFEWPVWNVRGSLGDIVNDEIISVSPTHIETEKGTVSWMAPRQ